MDLRQLRRNHRKREQGVVEFLMFTPFMFEFGYRIVHAFGYGPPQYNIGSRSARFHVERRGCQYPTDMELFFLGDDSISSYLSHPDRLQERLNENCARGEVAEIMRRLFRRDYEHSEERRARQRELEKTQLEHTGTDDDPSLEVSATAKAVQIAEAAAPVGGTDALATIKKVKLLAAEVGGLRTLKAILEALTT
jgi:hypothetical protein